MVFGLAESNYSTTFSNAKAPEPHMLSKAETFFYATFVILAWSLVLAWIVMMCVLGLAGEELDLEWPTMIYFCCIHAFKMSYLR